MLYYLLQYLERTFEPTGFQMFHFITVRAGLAAFTALLIALFVGRRIIRWLKNKQFGETVREGIDSGAIDHSHKRGTPSMGGLIILLSMLGATFLWGDIAKTQVWLVMLATAWMGAVGFADDYIKVVKKNKDGLSSGKKILGQLSIGLIVGAVIYFCYPYNAAAEIDTRTMTNFPFLKNQVFDYYPQYLQTLFGGADIGWLFYIPSVLFIMTAVSNAVNLTDGLDGLAAGVTSFVAAGLVILCYISGNAIYADFLHVLHLPGAGELTIFASAMAAACLGFLWFNAHPARVFMGDTGSLALGAAVASLCFLIKAELLIPLLCGVYFMEALSVVLQTGYFKITKKRYGQGKRIFRMAPLHHHFESTKKPKTDDPYWFKFGAGQVHESQLVIRFWIVTGLMVILTILTLRIR